MSLRLARLLALSCAAAVLTACVPSVRFQPTPLPPATSRRGSVEVGSVTSARAQERGGTTFAVVGRVRGGYGNPFSLKASRGQQLDVVLREVMSDALRHSGLDVAPGAKAASRLELEVQDFWCDGYVGYQVTATVLARLVDVRTGKTLAQHTISRKDGFGIVVGYGPMHASFNRVLDGIKQELVVFLEKEATVAMSRR